MSPRSVCDGMSAIYNMYTMQIALFLKKSDLFRNNFWFFHKYRNIEKKAWNIVHYRSIFKNIGNIVPLRSQTIMLVHSAHCKKDRTTGRQDRPVLCSCLVRTLWMSIMFWDNSRFKILRLTYCYFVILGPNDHWFSTGWEYFSDFREHFQLASAVYP